MEVARRRHRHAEQRLPERLAGRRRRQLDRHLGRQHLADDQHRPVRPRRRPRTVQPDPVADGERRIARRRARYFLCLAVAHMHHVAALPLVAVFVAHQVEHPVLRIGAVVDVKRIARVQPGSQHQGIGRRRRVAPPDRAASDRDRQILGIAGYPHQPQQVGAVQRIHLNRRRHRGEQRAQHRHRQLHCSPPSRTTRKKPLPAPASTRSSIGRDASPATADRAAPAASNRSGAAPAATL